MELRCIGEVKVFWVAGRITIPARRHSPRGALSLSATRPSASSKSA